MKKLYGYLLLTGVSLILVLVLRAFLPKYSGFLMYFFFFLLFDGYLWFSIRGTIRKLKPAARAAISVVYWLPLSLLSGIMVLGFFVTFPDWNLPLRTYAQNFILILFLAKIYPILALFIADLFRLARFGSGFFSPGKRVAISSIPRYHSLLAGGWILGGLIFTVMLSGTLFWQFDFRVRRQVIMLNDLPPSFDGLKIVQFSDVHLGSWGSKQQLQKAVNIMNGLNADLIFFTGDMFNYCTADGYGFEDILRTLHAPGGIYAIMGNHDYGDYISWPSSAAKQQNIDDLKAWYGKLGWKLLLNSNEIIKRGTDSIAVIGVENWGATLRFQRLGDLDLARKGTESMPVQLLLSHDPSHWDSIVSKSYRNIDVTFAGHTHGGQVGVDLCDIHWSPVSWIYPQWCGLYANPGPGAPQYLYVNQGLGNIGYSGRIGILPEITVVILKRAGENDRVTGK